MNRQIKNYIEKELKRFKEINVNELFPYFEYIVEKNTTIHTFSDLSQTLPNQFKELARNDSLKELESLFALIARQLEPFIKKVSWIINGDVLVDDLMDCKKSLSYYLDKMGIEFRSKKKQSPNYDRLFSLAYELRDTQAHTSRCRSHYELVRDTNYILYGYFYVIKVNLPYLKSVIDAKELLAKPGDVIPVMVWKSILPISSSYFDLFTLETLPKKIEIQMDGDVFTECFDEFGIMHHNNQKPSITYDDDGNVIKIDNGINDICILKYENGLFKSAEGNIRKNYGELVYVDRLANGNIIFNINWYASGTIKLCFRSDGKMLFRQLTNNSGFTEKRSYNYEGNTVKSRDIINSFGDKRTELAEIANNILTFKSGDTITEEIHYSGSKIIAINSNNDNFSYKFTY